MWEFLSPAAWRSSYTFASAMAVAVIGLPTPRSGGMATLVRAPPPAPVLGGCLRLWPEGASPMVYYPNFTLSM